MKKKIVVRLQGGLGNQLFIYASTKSLALRSDAEHLLDYISGFERDFAYKRSYQLHRFNISSDLCSDSDRFEPFGRQRRFYMRNAYRNSDFKYSKYIFQTSSSFSQEFLQLETRFPKVYVEGYWQSQKYFEDINTIIRNEFQLKDDLMPDVLVAKNQIVRQNSVCVHFRSFSAESQTSKHHVAEVSKRYYKAAFNFILSTIPAAHFYIFSDKRSDAFKVLPLENISHTFVSDLLEQTDPFSDLYLMTQCRHHIISNSTFAWWGAWLNNDPSQIVISPRMEETNQWGFSGLIPDKWLVL
ncbi:alpha-1,2-fucosyltransferase [bacterium]|nr:alpha-1,2-fucosyltransferase [bacterium]